MAIRRFSIARPGVKSNQFWDQDTQQGAIVPLATVSQTVFDNFGFFNIPGGYQDLMIVGSLSTQAIGSPSDWLGAWFNSDATVGNYSTTRIYGNGVAPVTANRTTSGLVTGLRPPNMAGHFGTFIFHVLDYTSTTKFKTMITSFASDVVGTSGFVGKTVGTWRNTAAVNTIWFTGTANYPGAGSTITIYGVKAGA